jgi:hypothetical protein
MDVFTKDYDHRTLAELLCYKNIPEGEGLVHEKLNHLFEKQYLWFPCPSKCAILVLPGLPDLIEYCTNYMASNDTSLDGKIDGHYKYDKKDNCVHCATACAVCVILYDDDMIPHAERLEYESYIKRYIKI